MNRLTLILGLLAVVLAFPDAAPAAPEATEILQAYARAQDKIHGFTVHYTQELRTGKMFRCEGWYSYDFRQSRYIHREHRWQPDRGQTAERASFMLKHWDSQTFYQYSATTYAWGTISRGNDELARTLREYPLRGLCRGFPGKDMIGYPLQAELRFDEFVRDAPLVLRGEMESVGSFLCYVVEADTRFGYVTAWFDPEREYSLIQFRIEKGQDEHYQRAYIEVTVSNLEKVDGLWLPVEGRGKEDWRLLDGEVIYREWHVRLDSFSVNPDFEAQGAFELSDVPDDSIWRYMDAQDVAYRWDGGRLTRLPGEHPFGETRGGLPTTVWRPRPTPKQTSSVDIPESATGLPEPDAVGREAGTSTSWIGLVAIGLIVIACVGALVKIRGM